MAIVKAIPVLGISIPAGASIPLPPDEEEKEKKAVQTTWVYVLIATLIIAAAWLMGRRK